MTNHEYFQVILNKVSEIEKQFENFCREKNKTLRKNNKWLRVDLSFERSTKRRKENGLYYYYVTVTVTETDTNNWKERRIFKGCFHSFNLNPVQSPSELGPYKRVDLKWERAMKEGVIPLEETPQIGEVELKYTPSESSCLGRNRFGNYKWGYLLAHGDIDEICGCDVHVTSLFVRDIFENRKLISRALCEKMVSAIRSNGLWINESDKQINWQKSLEGIKGVKVK